MQAFIPMLEQIPVDMISIIHPWNESVEAAIIPQDKESDLSIETVF